MVLVLLAVLVIGSFAPLMRVASKGSTASATLGALEAALLTFGAGVTALAALV
jgi:hypothetical protein